jgi:hypothetical protein
MNLIEKEIAHIRDHLDEIETRSKGLYPPAKPKPYEMLGKLHFEPKTTIGRDNPDGEMLMVDRTFPVAVGYRNHENAIFFRQLLHEHSCGRGALELLKHIKDHLDQGNNYRIGRSSLSYKKIVETLARLDAGPEKGV